MIYTMPQVGSEWKRKLDGRIDCVAECEGEFVRLYNADMNRHWHVQIQNFWKEYEDVNRDAEH